MKYDENIHERGEEYGGSGGFEASDSYNGPIRFQSWNRHTQDSHNYIRGDDEDASKYFRRLRARYEVLSNMESTRKHLSFYTHTNPFGCPWCELFVVAGLAIKGGAELADIYEELLGEVEEDLNQQSPPMTTRTEHLNNRPETAAVQNVFYKKEGSGASPDSAVESDEGAISGVGVDDSQEQ